jgi:hypothetical protein
MVCPYLHRRLAFLLVLRLLAITSANYPTLDRMAYDYDTRPHVWSYQAWNQRKT